MTSRFRILFVCLLVLAAVPTWTCAAAAASDAVEVDLGLEEVHDVSYVHAIDRIVVVGDDEAQIYGLSGTRLVTIPGISGARLVDTAGTVAVVLASGTNELVVIDVAAGREVRRIDPGPNRVGNIAVSADLVWYTHQRDDSGNNLGYARISTGASTPSFDDVGLRSIDASPAWPESVFGIDSRSLVRVDLDQGPKYSRDRGFTGQVVVDDAGESIYVERNGNVVVYATETLHQPGLFFGPPISRSDRNSYHFSGMAVDDGVLVKAVDRAISVYDTEQRNALRTFFTSGDIRGLELGGDRIVAVQHGSRLPNQSARTRTVLLIAPYDYQPETQHITISLAGYGLVPSFARPKVEWFCSSGASGEFAAAYGYSFTFELPSNEENCGVNLERVAGVVQSSVHAQNTSRVRHDGVIFSLSRDQSQNHVLLVHEFKSVFNDEAAFVAQQYLDLLDREPTDFEMERGLRRLTDGNVSRQGLTAELVESKDFLGRVAPISRLYLSYFGRWPDESGLSFWLMQSRDGVSLEATSNYFAASPEFDTQYGRLSDREFVSLVYGNVLDREADEAGFAYWTSQLDLGLSRGELMTGFSESPESIKAVQATIVVRSLYHSLLERGPDAAGLAFWASEYEHGRSLDGLVAGFLESSEYANRFWHTVPVAGHSVSDLGTGELAAVSALALTQADRDAVLLEMTD